MSRQSEGAAATATREALIEQLLAGCPGLTPETAAAVIADLAPQVRFAARKHLDAHPAALTSGASEAIASVQEIIGRLIEAGYTSARQPACTQCGRLRFLAHLVPGGRICESCGTAARYWASVAVCRRCGKTRPCPARGVCQSWRHSSIRRCGMRAPHGRSRRSPHQPSCQARALRTDRSGVEVPHAGPVEGQVRAYTQFSVKLRFARRRSRSGCNCNGSPRSCMSAPERRSSWHRMVGPLVGYTSWPAKKRLNCCPDWTMLRTWGRRLRS